MTKGHYFVIRVINSVLAVIELFLVFRFALKLFGASPSANFVDWFYRTTDPLISPFRGAFPSPVIESGMIIEFNTLFAILVYAIIGWLLTEFIYIVARAGKVTEH